MMSHILWRQATGDLCGSGSPTYRAQSAVLAYSLCCRLASELSVRHLAVGGATRSAIL